MNGVTLTPMRAITIRQPWLWAICRGGKDVENRSNRRGSNLAAAQFNRPGPVLLHASSRWADAAAEAKVRRLSTVDPGIAGGPRADPACYGNSGIVATAVIADVHTAVDCYDPTTGAMCSPWADTAAAHIHLTDVHVLPTPIPCPGALGLWTVDDPHILATIRRHTP